MCGIKRIQPEIPSGECECVSGRKLLTRQEKIEKLKAYKEDLEKELTAVKETLEEITGEN